MLKLRRGEIDLLQNDLSAEMLDYLEEQPGISIGYGTGSNFAYLGFNLQDPVTGRLVGYIREGDLLVSSGLGGRFPVGYPVAVVTAVDRDPGQPFARITAQPRAALDRSRHVLLVFTGDPPQQDN